MATSPPSPIDIATQARSLLSRRFGWGARRRFRTRLAQRFASFLESGATLAFPTRDKPVVSIVIVTYRQPDLGFACLQSIRSCVQAAYEVILVDNGADRLTGRLLDRLDGVEIIRNSENRGYVEACHQGADRAAAPWLLFLNDDVVFFDDAVSPAIKSLTAPNIGAVGAKLILPTGRLQEAGGVILSDGQTRGLGRNRRWSDARFDRAQTVDYVSGAFLLTKTAVWFSLGGYDPRFSPGYYEDVDYCVRLRQSGFDVLYHPRCQVIHFEHGSSSKKDALALMRAHRQAFHDKHGDVSSLT